MRDRDREGGGQSGLRRSWLFSLSQISISSKSRGFTLLELLVSISIITLLIGTGIPAFRHFGRVSALDQAADQVKGAILDTRAYALAPRAQKPSSVTWYQISFDQVGEAYTVAEGASTTISTANLPPFIQISSAPTALGFSVCDGNLVNLVSPGLTTQTCPNRLTTDPAPIVLHNSQLATDQRIITVNRQTGAVSISR